MQSIQSGLYQSVIFHSGQQPRAISPFKDINSYTAWCDGLMNKSDERKCTSTAKSASKSNQASKQQLDSKIRADEAFLRLIRGAVFAMKCGGAKARNSMRAYVQIRRDLEDRVWQKIQRRVIVKG